MNASNLKGIDIGRYTQPGYGVLNDSLSLLVEEATSVLTPGASWRKYIL